MTLFVSKILPLLFDLLAREPIGSREPYNNINASITKLGCVYLTSFLSRTEVYHLNFNSGIVSYDVVQSQGWSYCLSNAFPVRSFEL